VIQLSLGSIAKVVSGRVIGDPEFVVDAVSTLKDASNTALSFFANRRYLAQLKDTSAGAVLVQEGDLGVAPCHAIVVADPYLAYAAISHSFLPAYRSSLPVVENHIHSSAVIAPDALIAQTGVIIGPNVVIDAGASISTGVKVGANCVIGPHSSLGKNTVLHANVSLYSNVAIGENCVIHSGAVLGADGFGFAKNGEQWDKIAQLGGVRLGNNVEVGSGTTIDRGALSDTVIADGVKLDNQIQVAHNVEIGANTAIAGCTAIAGSTRIGAQCTIAGASGITGHLDIAPNTHITAMTLVSRSIKDSGAYSSGTGMMPTRDWKRSVARFRNLDDMAKRLKSLEHSADIPKGK